MGAGSNSPFKPYRYGGQPPLSWRNSHTIDENNVPRTFGAGHSIMPLRAAATQVAPEVELVAQPGPETMRVALRHT
jgi:hypothetical protein